MKYLVVVEKTGAGFSAYSPDLSGCVATGATRKEVERRIGEALTLHLEGLREDGRDAPPAQSYSTYFDIPA